MFDLKAVYGVFFMNFHLDGRRQARFRTDIDLRDMKTNEPFSDKMRFIFLDLPAFTKDEERCETDFERWIYVLKNMEILQRMPFKARKSVFEELEKIADISALSKEDQEKYEEIIKVYRDNLVTEQWAIEKGHKEGILLTARNMKNKGYSSEDIAQITGLTLEEIYKL